METNNKLRKALTKILNLTNSLDEDCAVDPVDMRDIAKAALAEPRKNCEVGTAEEQAERFDEFCKLDDKVGCGDCPLWTNGLIGHHCELAWAQLPYTDGDGQTWSVEARICE